MICDQSPFLVLKQTFQVIVPRKHNSRAEMMAEVGPQAKDQSYSFKNILISFLASQDAIEGMFVSD